jgi:oligoribonuclease NrnB/cAMP/cGMP phosphodiesterase (DHH superfamily)
MRRVCFFHRADLDGKCAGAVIYHHFKGDVEMVGVNYGDDYERVIFSKVDKDTVAFMVDFSMQPWDLMARLLASCKHFVWIDHHIEAIKQYEAWAEWPHKKIDGIREDGTAACTLTWMWTHNSEKVPEFINLLGLYDVWKWEGVRDALEFQMGMRMEDTWPMDPIWVKLFEPSGAGIRSWELIRVVEQGAAVVKYTKQQNKIHMKAAAFEILWRGKVWLAINEMFCNSQLFDSLYDSKLHHGMMAFGWRGKKWHFSLYTTRDDVDVGAICTEVGKELKTGGGGHKKAAGFQALELPFDLKKTEIVYTGKKEE